MVIFFIFCELDTCSRDLEKNFTVGNCLLSPVEISINMDIVIMVLDLMHVLGLAKMGGGGAVNNSLSVHTDKTKKDTLVLDEGSTD